MDTKNLARFHTTGHRAWMTLAVVAALASTAPVRAATLTWGTSGTGGSGTWNTTDTNWWTGSPATWSNSAPDSAVFAGTAGTVTLTTSNTANGLTFATTGYTLTGGTLTLAGSTPTITTNSGVTATVASVLSGTTLAKSGAGTLNLSGSVSLTGATTVNNGTLQLSGSGSMGDISLAGSTALVVATGANMSMGTLNSSATQATLNIQSGATLTSSAFSNGWTFAGITSNGTWNVTGNMLLSINNPTTIAGSGTVNVGTITNQNSTTANFTVSRLNIGSGGIVQGSSAGSAINFNGSTVGASANWSSSLALTLQQTTTFNTLDSVDGSTARTITLSGVLGGSGALAKAGAGTLTLSAANTYSGGTVINQGTVIAAAAANFSNSNFGTGTITINPGATLQANQVHQFGWNAGTWNNFVINSGGTFAIGSNDNYIGSLSLTGDARITGSARIGLAAGAVTYTGTSSSNQATIAPSLRLASPQANVTGTFTVNGSNPNGDLVLSGVLEAGGGLTKSGTGILRLNNTNTYTGGTIVNQGTLVVAGPSPFNSSSNLGSGTVTINSGATLQANAVHQFGWNAGSWNNFVINSGTFAIGGNDNYIGSLSLTENAAVTGSGYVGISTGTLNYTGTTASSQATIASKLALVSPQGNVNAILTINGSNPNGDLVVSGIISGSVLTKSGTGILRLSGNNTQTGNTTISQGTIIAANSSAFGTGTVTINDGSTGSNNTTLLISTAGASITINRAISVTGSGSGVTTIGSGTFGSGSDQAIYSGAVTLAKNVTLVSATGGDRTQFSGGIGGTGNVTITGGLRTVFATTANTYTGTTTVSATSTLQLSDGTATATSFLPDTQVAVVNGILNFAKGSNSETIGGLSGSGVVQELQTNNPTLIVDGGQSQVFSGTIANGGGTMAFTKSGAGTQVLTGSNTYTGATTITGGTLQIGNGGTTGSIASASAVSGSAGAALAFSRSNAVTYSGTYGGAGNLVQLGTGTLTLSANNTYTGTTSLAGGVLSLGSANAIGTSGTITFGGGTLQYSASNTTDYSNRFSTAAGQAFSIDTNGQGVTLGTALTSSGATLAKLGSGTLTLTANNTYSGATTISAGVLRLGNGGSAGSVAGSIVNNASLLVNRADAFNLSNAISGSGGVEQAGSGTTTLSGINSYSGATTISGGALAVSQDANLGTAPGSATPSSLVINGGTLAITTGFTISANRGIAVGPASGAGVGTISVASGQTAGYAGTIANNGAGIDGLVKAGAGVLALSGNHTYSGTTSINAGTLQVTSGSLASAAVTVAGGATLSGAGTLNATTVANLGILSPGVGGVGTLTLSSVAFSGTGTVNVGVVGNATSTLLQVNGNVTAGGGANSVTFAFGNSLASVNSGTYSLLSYTGSQLSDVSAFTYSGVSGARQSLNLVNATQAVNLVVGNAFPIWSGTDGSGWSTTNNWVLSSNNSPTSFLVGDTVMFDDSGATGTVTLSQNVNPATTTFSGTSLAYTLSSSGGFGITTGALVKNGPASLTITTSNSYTGGTTLSAGTLRVGNDAALGTGVVTAGGAALTSDGASARTLANAVALTGDLTLGNAVDTGVLTLSGTVDLGAATRTLTMPSNVTLSGQVTNGGLTKAGAGVLTVTGSNDYALGTTLSAGTILAGNNAALGVGGVTLANGVTLSSDSTTGRTLTNAFTLNGDVTLGNAINSGALTLGGVGGVNFGGATRQVTTASDVTFAGAVSSGGLTKAGTGTLTLAAANSYAGGTTLSAGDIVLGNVAALGSGNLTFAAPVTVRTTVGGTIANGVVVNAVSGTFDAGANAVTLSGSIAVATGGSLTFVPSAAQALTGVISGSGTIVKIGSGSLSLVGTNTLTGTVSLSAGQLNLNNASALGTGSLVISNGSTLDNTSGTAVSLTGANPQAWNGDFTFAGSNPLNVGTGTVTLSGNRQVTVTSSTLTVGGAIGGNFGLTKAGAGTLALIGASGYSGGTTLSAGTLLVGNATALGTGTVALNGGTLTVNGATVANNVVLGGGAVGTSGGTLSGILSGTGGLTVTGAGALTLTGSSTYSGGTTISGGTLQIGAGSTTGWIPGPITNNAALVFNRSDSLTYGGTIGGNGTLTKLGAGTLTLTAANTVTGTTTITSGTLELSAGGNLAGPVANAATFQFNRGDAFTYSGVISGTGAVRQVGTGTTTLAGNNSFSGQLTVAQGVLATGTINNASTNGPLGNSSSAVVLGGNGSTGGLAYTGATASSNKAFSLATGGTGSIDVAASVTLTLSSAIGGSGALLKQGAGTLTLSAANTYSGGTVISQGTVIGNGPQGWQNTGGISNFGTGSITINSGGTVQANAPHQFGWNAGTFNNFVINSGTLAIGSNDNYIGSLALTENAAVTGASGNYVGLTTGSVNYTGTTVTSQATIAPSVALASPTGNVNATFTVNGSNPNGDLVVSGLIYGSSSLTKAGTGILRVTATNNYTGNTTINAGTFQIGAGGQIYNGGFRNATVSVASGATLDLQNWQYNTSGTASLGGLAANETSIVVNGGTIRISGTAPTSYGRGVTVNSGGATLDAAAGANWTIDTVLDSFAWAYNGNPSIALTGGGTGRFDKVLGNGTGGLTKSGTGTWTLTGVNTFTGNTTISAGTLVLGGAGQLGGGTYGGAIANAGNFQITSSANQTLSGVVSGVGAISKSGAGTLALTNASNSFSGGATLTAGVLSFANDALGPSGTISLGGGTLQWASGNTQDISSRLALANSTTTTLDVGSNDVTLANNVGAGSTAGLVKSGAGALTLSSSNGFSGDLSVAAGTIRMGNDAALGSGGVLLANGAAISSDGVTARSIANAVTANGNVTLGDATNSGSLSLTGGVNLGGGTRTLATPSNVTIASVVSNGGLTKAGAGVLTLSAANTYTGATTINAGSLALSGLGDISSGSAAVVTIAPGAALDISAASGARTIGALDGGDATSQVILGGNSLRSVVAGPSQFGGVISGAGGFTKAGSAQLEMTSIQAFTGLANIEEGRLLIASGTGLASASKIYVASGAFIESYGGALTVVNSQTLGGYGTISGDLAFAPGGILSPGGSVGTLFGDAGTTTFNGGMRYLFEVNDASGTPGIDAGWDLFSTSGALTLAITGTDQIFVDLTSLAGTGTGQAANFDANSNYAWKFVVAGSTIDYQYALNPTWFNVQTGNFQNTTNGNFYVARGDQLGAVNVSGGTANELYVVYAAVPEPGTLALAGIGLAAAGWVFRRRRRMIPLW